ncbi:D-TA family PLP-dependent enzyme [Mucilaginibacter sp.]|uniref:D-TA family PLP-dependent enzyme n=1 Tax=Mucilaginibacter sp. TaxID=1882438 RepID=UPI0035BC3CE4
MGQKEWYIIDNINEIDTPALVVYPDRVLQNIDLLKTMVDDAGRLRPHVKSHKSIDVIKLMLQNGIEKFKCATIAEAEMLGMASAPDALVAYQPNGPKLERFIALIKAYPDTAYSCLVDNRQTALAISNKAIEHSISISVYIDLNVGMNRTGIIPDNSALTLYKECLTLPGVTLRGLHAYDGHIHDSDFEIREQRSETSMVPVWKLIDQITAAGLGKPDLIAGSSPTLPVIARLKEIDISPGTFIYWDKGYQSAYPEQPFLPAALLIARVISLPENGKVCIDLGHKSVSSESELSKRIFFLNATDLKFIGHSEEHLVAEAGLDHNYKIGDILYGLPYHVCPSVALYERALTVVNNAVKGEWLTTARDRKINI